MLLKLLTKVFGSRNERVLKSMRKRVETSMPLSQQWKH